MEKTVREMKSIIRNLILEVGDLKERVSMLESSFNPVAPAVLKPKKITPDIFLEGERYENLGRLYNEGYHVCPEIFGCSRAGECLFCLSLIGRE